MLFTILIGGIGGLAAISTIPYIGYVGFVYKFKVFDLYKYKMSKRNIYNKIYKAIQEKDIQSLRDYLNALHLFDEKYNRTKLPALKKKLGINDEILNNRKLFKMKYDSNYLVNCFLKIEDDDLTEFEKELKIKEKNLQSYEGFDKIKKKEQELIEKEKVLNEREKEIIEIIKNITKLQ